MIVGVLLNIVCFTLLLLMLIQHKYKKRAQFQVKEKINLKDVTVIIPFKNEEQTIVALLEDMRKQTHQPKQIIFVDDHSSDRSHALVTKWCEKHTNAVVFQLERGVNGKKNALRRGIYSTQSAFFLTIDADVRLSKNYFGNLENVSAFSLVILPVLMTATNWKSRMFSLEYHFFNAFNYLASPWFTLSASGANLLVNRKDFLNVDSIKEHHEIASGDDYFLLRDFQNSELEHTVSTNFGAAVYTESVDDFSSYFNQRSRWYQKTQTTKYREELLLGILILVYFLVTFLFVIYAVVSGHFLFGFVPVFIQTILASHILQLYKLPKDQAPPIWELFIFHIFYPFSLCYILIKSTFGKVKWNK